VHHEDRGQAGATREWSKIARLLQKFKGVPHGEASSVDYALYLSPAHEEAVLSYWHDIELPIQQLDSKHIVPMVDEIPKGYVARPK
jgi:hypothetical protein